MIEKLKLILRYLQFSFHAIGQYKIHSPFVYDFYVHVILTSPKRLNDNNLTTIQRLRKKLNSYSETFSTSDTGEKSRQRKSKTIGKKFKSISQSHKNGMFLSRLVKFVQPTNIIELGTGAGISALYLALTAPNTKIYTIEGNPAMIEKARELLKESPFKNIQIIEGLFDDVLPEILEKVQKPDLIFIDGNHNSKAMFKYFEMILPYVDQNTVIVFHDIYWSEDMMTGWKNLVKHPSVKLSIDTFDFGILFFMERIQKEHFKLK